MNLLTRMVVICAIFCFSFAYSINSISTAREYDNQEYTFYDSKHKILAKFPKALIYRLSKVIAKSANFGDHAEFIITLSNKPGDSRFQLSPESWTLFLNYLKAHEKEAESSLDFGSVQKSLHAIRSSSEMVLLDLLYFSSRYRFEELERSLIPVVDSIWYAYKTQLNLNGCIRDIKNLEEFIEKLFYSKKNFREVLSSRARFYPYFNFVAKEDIVIQNSNLTSVAISSNNSYIVSGLSNGKVILYDRATRQVKTIMNHDDDEVTSIAISYDNSCIAVGYFSEKIRLYDTVLEQDTIVIQDGYLNSVAISSDGRYVVFGSTNNDVQLYDRVTQQVKIIMNHASEVFSVAISDDNRFIVSGSADDKVKIYDMVLEQDKTISHDSWVRSVAISSDGRYIAFGSTNAKVKLYDRVLNNVSAIVTHDDWVRSVAISSDGRYIVSGSDDDKVKLYDRVLNNVSTIFHDHSVYSVAISKNSKFIVSGSIDGVVKLAGSVKRLSDEKFFALIEKMLPK